MINKEEKEYLLSLLSSVDLTHKSYMNGVFMVFPSPSLDSETILFTKLQNLDTWFNKIDSLSGKVTYSLNESICYCEKIERFDILNNQKSKEEIYFEYFLENAVFRLITLWDMLAQLCNIYFETNVECGLITYKLYFCGKNRKSRKVTAVSHKRTEYEVFRKKVKKYLDEKIKEDTEEEQLPKVDDVWEGNHDYVSNMIRNPLTHNHDPYTFGILNNSVNMRNIPPYDLKRVIEDYKKVNEYIHEIKNFINAELEKNN